MTRLWIRLVLFGLAIGVTTRVDAQCASMAAVVNGNNATDNLASVQLRKMVLGDVRTWPNGRKVTLIGSGPSSPVFKCILDKVLHMSDAEYRKYVMGAEFRGEEPVRSISATSPVGIANLVSLFSGSFAIVEKGMVPLLPTGVKVVRIDGKAFGQPGYPL